MGDTKKESPNRATEKIIHNILCFAHGIKNFTLWQELIVGKQFSDIVNNIISLRFNKSITAEVVGTLNVVSYLLC